MGKEIKFIKTGQYKQPLGFHLCLEKHNQNLRRLLPCYLW